MPEDSDVPLVPRQHLFEKKPSTRTRRLGRDADVAPADQKAVKRLLGI